MRLAVLACVLACGSSTKPTPAPSPSPSLPASTGAVGEEEFKAMHAPPTSTPVQLHGTDLTIGGARAYLSVPAGKPPFPGIVVIHEWWGLNDNIKHWSDRLASAGWAALAIDLYGGTVATTPDAAMAAMKGVDENTAKQIISSAITFLHDDPRVAAQRRAVIGWCFGGGWSLQSGLAHPELDGVIMYYGQPETDPAKLAAIKGRVLGFFGNKDKGIPPPKVDELEAALKQAGVRSEIHRYDAEHAFANPSNPHYDEPSAADAWSHVLEFLATLRQ